MYIDTHAHLGMIVKGHVEPLVAAHFPMLQDVVDEANNVGVKKIITIGANLVESVEAVHIAQRIPTVFATVGIHPCDCTDQWRNDVDQLDLLIKKTEGNIIVAIGEIGLDFYHKPFDKQRQLDALKAQIELSLKHSLPLVLHVRDAGEELLYAIEPYVKEIKGGVIHCFSQNSDFARTVLSWGLYCGIDAPIMYPKNEALREVVKEIPLEKMILETDAPFLPPLQFRGKQNKPAYIRHFVPMLAVLKGVSEDALGKVTTENAHALFGLER
ncbi:MAG: TatD family hydrolase [Candidatus Babeliales bacterium]